MKITKKLLTFSLTALTAVTLLSFNSLAAGWQKDDTGWTYQKEDGTYAIGSLIKIKNYWYYFDEFGYMVTGDVKIDDGWFNFNSDGVCTNPTYKNVPAGAPNKGWVPVGDSDVGFERSLNGHAALHDHIYWQAPDAEEHFGKDRPGVIYAPGVNSKYTV